MKKYLFFDIDGTLLPFKAKQVPFSTYSALQKLKENGHFVCLATGRQVGITKDLMQELKIENAVCDGGNEIILNNEVVFKTCLDQDLLRKTVAECERINLGWAVSIDDSFLLQTRSLGFIERNKDHLGIYQVVYDEGLDLYDCKKISRILIDHDPDKIARLSYLDKLGYMYYPNSSFALIEPDDKMKGIKKVIELIGGNFEDVIVFGDGLNDIKMFEKAPFSVAMGNACDELKRISDYVTKSSEEDGIYVACLALNLIKK